MSGAIAYTAVMAGALWQGRKTQTRRVISPGVPTRDHRELYVSRGRHWWLAGELGTEFGDWWPDTEKGLVAKYRKGDVCAVLEPHRIVALRYFGAEVLVMYECDGFLRTVTLPADGNDREELLKRKKLNAVLPGRYMRRCFSRGKVEIVGVRAERVQEITTADIIAEGAFVDVGEGMADEEMDAVAREQFEALWDSINGKREGGVFSWSANPWVWVIEQRVVECLTAQGGGGISDTGERKAERGEGAR